MEAAETKTLGRRWRTKKTFGSDEDAGGDVGSGGGEAAAAEAAAEGADVRKLKSAAATKKVGDEEETKTFGSEAQEAATKIKVGPEAKRSVEEGRGGEEEGGRRR